MGLLGRNGAGKTTTIRILMGVFPPNQGEVLVDGHPIDYHKISLGYLPEERGLYPKKPIGDQLVYFAQLKGMNRTDALSSVRHWLTRLGMEKYERKRLNTLSKGNQQKIQLITALAHNPDIVVLDEPFSGLDPVNANLLKEVVMEQMEQKKVILFSSHQMNYIEEFCQEIAILNQGHIAISGNLVQIKRKYPRDRLVVHSPQYHQILQDLTSCCQMLRSGQVLLHLDSPDQKRDVMRMLLEKYDIDRVEVFEPSLNDIFVQYSKDPAEERSTL